MNPIQIYRNVIDFLSFFSERENPQCTKCGYKFKFDKSVTVHPQCKDKFLFAGRKKLVKLKNRYFKNPSKCPVCKQKLWESKIAGYVCPQCNNLQNYKFSI